MSFDNKPENNSSDQMTFNVGDRSFTAETAVTKIEAGDAHITKIESENQDYQTKIAAMQLQLDQSTKIDDALAKLSLPQQPSQDSQPTEVTPSVSEDQIGVIATKQIEEYLANQRTQDSQVAAKALADKTFDETEARLKVKYGDKYQEAVQLQATKLGVDLNRMTQMASDPVTAQLLLAQMDVSATPAQATPQDSFASPRSEQAAPAATIDWTKGGSKHIFEALQDARKLEANSR